MPGVLTRLAGEACVEEPDVDVSLRESCSLFVSSLPPSSPGFNLSSLYSPDHAPSQSNFRASIYILLLLGLAHFIWQSY